MQGKRKKKLHEISLWPEILLVNELFLSNNLAFPSWGVWRIDGMFTGVRDLFFPQSPQNSHSYRMFFLKTSYKIVTWYMGWSHNSCCPQIPQDSSTCDFLNLAFFPAVVLRFLPTGSHNFTSRGYQELLKREHCTSLSIPLLGLL